LVYLCAWQVDPLTHQVKICDFGSAKVLVWFSCVMFLFISFNFIITVFLRALMEECSAAIMIADERIMHDMEF
jgi:hypothetical protein